MIYHRYNILRKLLHGAVRVPPGQRFPLGWVVRDEQLWREGNGGSKISRSHTTLKFSAAEILAGSSRKDRKLSPNGLINVRRSIISSRRHYGNRHANPSYLAGISLHGKTLVYVRWDMDRSVTMRGVYDALTATFFLTTGTLKRSMHLDISPVPLTFSLVSDRRRCCGDGVAG
eukprot:748712-Hanusia_phi.AAC.1